MPPPPGADVAMHALHRVARYLVSDAGADVGGALAVLGLALDADAVAFAPAGDLGGGARAWTRDPAAHRHAPDSPAPPRTRTTAGRGGGHLDLPVVAADGRTIGTIRVEGGAAADLAGGPGALVGDVIAAHLGRPAAPPDERAARDVVEALDAERERIGQDLHDNVGQLLTSVRMLSEGLAEDPSLAQALGGLDETAGRIAAYAAEALDRVRSACRGLVPPPFPAGGVAGALADLAEHADALGPARCEFQHDAGADLADPDAALQAYRIAQEAVANALRHAGATAVQIRLGRDAGRVVVEVADDGVGFAADAERGRSLGLPGMARRARSVGATLDVGPRPGGGTTVRAAFPAPPPSASNTPGPDAHGRDSGDG